MGLMRRPWKLTNVAVKDMEIHAMGHAAGIVAWMEPESARRLPTIFLILRNAEWRKIPGFILMEEAQGDCGSHYPE